MPHTWPLDAHSACCGTPIGQRGRAPPWPLARPGPRKRPRPCKRICVILITSLCASRSGWLPASPNSKVYCIPHKPPAYGGGLWGFRTAPYSPPLFFCFAKKPGAGSWTSGHSHPGGNSPPHPEAHLTFSYGKSEGELLTARPTAPA